LLGIGLAGLTGGTVVQGNFIGTNASGTAAVPNFLAGVDISSNNNTVAGNLISGNRRNGVSVLRSGNLIVGNYLGTDKDGTAAVPNGWNGIALVGDGGNTAQDNVISGNGRNGVFIIGPNNTVKGGFIGTNAAGTQALPNQTGVYVREGDNNVIGPK